MRNGRGDQFTKTLRRRIIQLRREASVARKELRPIEDLSKRLIITELQLVILEYSRWKGFKP
jgi:hypothetical protein